MSAAPPIRIRRGRAADLPALARFEAAAFDHPWSGPQLADELASGRSAIWLIEEQPDGGASRSDPLGYAIFLLLVGETELLRVATRTDGRRRGYASRLLGRALRVLERSGRPRCHLEVASGNVSALALYERLGFSVSGGRASYYADGSDAVTMSRGPAGNG